MSGDKEQPVKPDFLDEYAYLRSNFYDDLVREIASFKGLNQETALPLYLLSGKEALASFVRLAATAEGAHNHRTGFVVFCKDKTSFTIPREMPGAGAFKQILTTGRIRHGGSYYNPVEKKE